MRSTEIKLVWANLHGKASVRSWTVHFAPYSRPALHKGHCAFDLFGLRRDKSSKAVDSRVELT